MEANTIALRAKPKVKAKPRAKVQAQDQECCDCVEDQVCYRCVHLTKNLRKVGINTIFTGGSTTVKYEVGDALVKNPLLNTLPKSYK